MEEKLSHLLEQYFNLYHADMISRAITDKEISLFQFKEGLKKVCWSEKNTNVEEYTPIEFEMV